MLNSIHVCNNIISSPARKLQQCLFTVWMVCAATSTITTTVTSRIAKIFNNTVARHFERRPTERAGFKTRTGLKKFRRPHSRWYRGHRMRTFFLRKTQIFSIVCRNMSDFGFPSSSSSNSSGGMNGAQRAELMDQVKSQLLVATLQELLSVSVVRCRYMCSKRALASFHLYKLIWSYIIPMHTSKINGNKSQLAVDMVHSETFSVKCRIGEKSMM